MKRLSSCFAAALIACAAPAMFATIAPAHAQVMGARPGYNSVLLKNEARRQQFQAKLKASQVRQGMTKSTGAAATKVQ